MPTPSIQTLVTDAQQVLNLDSISAVRSVVAVALANANTGTPLNPNLTTQQLWNEFYQVVTKPKSDIESIIANQLMKFLFAPPAPGGVGANKQVIFNDGGVLAGDPQFLWDKTTNLLTVTGSATITGDLTVDTNTLKVDSANNRVSVGTTSQYGRLTVGVGSGLQAGTTTNVAHTLIDVDYASTGDINTRLSFANSNGATNAAIDRIGNPYFNDSGNLAFLTRSLAGSLTERYRIAADGVATWSNVGGVAGTAMTLNSTGLGVGTSNFAYKLNAAGFIAAVDPSFTGTGGSLIGAMLNNDNTAPGLDLRRWTGTAGTHGTTYICTDATGATFFYNGQQASNTKATSLKMTLDVSGNLLLNAPSFAVNNGKLRIQHTGLAGEWAIQTASNTTDGYAAVFYTTTGQAGFISVSGTSATFSTSSDYRLKEAVQPLVGGLARISALKPSIYKWKADGSSGEGFLAHELAEVVPLAVTGEKDAVNEDGSIKAQGVDLSKVVPVLVAAIQELTARVQTLETR